MPRHFCLLLLFIKAPMFRVSLAVYKIASVGFKTDLQCMHKDRIADGEGDERLEHQFNASWKGQAYISLIIDNLDTNIQNSKMFCNVRRA